MAVDLKISRKLDNNYVQVDVSSKNMQTKYYRVPQNKADSFCANYKKNDKSMNFKSNAAFIGAAFAGCIGASFLTKNLKSAAKFAIGIVSGVVCGTAATYGMAGAMEKSYKNLLATHGAEQIFYDDKKSII